MPLTKPQQTIFSDTSRFRVVAAGRRFGKTFLSMWEIARVARHPNSKIYYIAPSYRMGKNIIWEDLKTELIKRRWVAKVNESDLTITLVNNSRISVRSADNPDSMRGVSLDAVILDEAAYMSKETWTSVIRPTLSDRQGTALFISTPRGYDWFHEMWSNAHNNKDWSAFQFTTVEGGQVTETEVESAKQDLDLRTFRQEYMATFENVANNVYYAWDMANVKAWEEPVPRTLLVGIDFNIDPVTSIVCVQTEDGLHVIDEIIIPNSNTDELAQAIISRYGGNRIIAFPDPAGSARKTSSKGRTDHIILQECGMQVKARRAHPAIKDRINAMNRLLCDANGVRKLFVDPKCKKTIEMFQKHEYKDGTGLPSKTDGYDHTSDALGYCVEYMFPIRRPQLDLGSQPQTWGHV